jgi:hypothetical protein
LQELLQPAPKVGMPQLRNLSAAQRLQAQYIRLLDYSEGTCSILQWSILSIHQKSAPYLKFVDVKD